MDEELFKRSINSETGARFAHKNVVSEPFVDRLGNSLTLEGHTGCVNCLDWNMNGTLLASGSDDKQARIWDCAGTCLHVLRTGHTQNIFSSMFLPAGGDRVLITAAGDGTVRLHHYTHFDDDPYVWTCEGRVKRLCVAYNDPQMFWSASEDGVIRQYDARTNLGLPLLTFRGRQCKTMAVDQSNPNILAVGTTETYIPLYDRRMAKVQEPLMRLVPGHLSFEDHNAKSGNHRYHSVFATHLAFNSTGNEVIANIGSEQVYIFDVKHDPGSPIDVLRDINRFLEAPTLLENPIANVEQHATSRFKQLRERAKDAFGNHDFTKAIEIYSQGITECQKLCGSEPALSSEHAMDLVLLLSNRGAGLLMRGWSGDAYSCVRDMMRCLKIDPSNKKAHYRLVRALIMLKQVRIGNKCLDLFRLRYPGEKSIERLDSMLNELTSSQSRRPRDIEWHASTSGERPFRDFVDRLCGHRNMNTDIKEANWWGGRDEFVVAGSDCGSLLIWERTSGRLLRMLQADSHIVNVVQPHPSRCLLATSGIDDVVRFWEPLPEDGSKNELVRDTRKFSDDNNKRMSVDLMEFLVSAIHQVSGAMGGEDEEHDGDGDGATERVQCTTS
uniref:WD and tetratricopeptide repeats protein 1 n=1 Tax=Steinernema glaseri TaxID=37863 RepID=A0A1I8AI21_9BILA